MTEKSRATAIAAALFAVVAWGASFIATKIAVAEAAPMTIVWLRFAMGVAVLGAVVLARRQLVRPAAGDLAYFALLGFSGIFLQQWLQANGLITSQASTSAWIVSSIPVFMASGWLLTSALFFSGPGLADVSRLSLRGWLAVLFLGIVCSGLAYVFWYDALRWLSASQAGSLIYLEPLVAVVVAAALLGERVTFGTLAGGFAILLGVWMVGLKPRRDEDPHPRPLSRHPSPPPRERGAPSQ